MTRGTVTLPMYAFSENAGLTRALGEALAQAFRRRGLPAQWTGAVPLDHCSLIEHWRSPSLLFSQSCGLPLVEALQDAVEPVGTFDWRGASAHGRYRSVVVSRGQYAGSLRPAVNGFHSLSGWLSLGVFLADHNQPLLPTLVTGSHRASLEALRSGQADLAAIDAVSWRLLSSFGHTEGLRVVGEGPVIPSLPAITSRALAVPRMVIHEAVIAALASPTGAAAARALGIEGFTDQDPTDFLSIPDWIQLAETVLPRQEAAS